MTVRELIYELTGLERDDTEVIMGESGQDLMSVDLLVDNSGNEKVYVY